MNRYEWAAFGVIMGCCVLFPIAFGPPAVNATRLQAIEDAHMRLSAAVVELRWQMSRDRPESER